MKSSKTLVLWEYQNMPDLKDDSTSLSIFELEQYFLTGKFLKSLFHYRQAIIYTNNLRLINRPFIKSLAMWILSWGPSFIKDNYGHVQRITIPLLIKFFIQHLKDVCMKPFIHRQTRKEIRSLMRGTDANPPFIRFQQMANPVYLRTDNCLGLNVGGSVTHTSGILNNLAHFTGKPIFLTPYLLPGISDTVEKHEVTPKNNFQAIRELMFLQYNKVLFDEAIKIIGKRNIAFIYQRYSLHNYSGVLLSRHFKIPLVLEYNGSEIWLCNKYASPLHNQDLWESIEMLNFRNSQLIVVVSKPIKDQLIKRGIDEKIILINPNGVDTDSYYPSIDGTEVRLKYNLENKIVFGFIGTFGRWHGAEVLVESFARLLKENAAFKSNIRLLMIGDGLTIPEVKRIVGKNNIEAECILTGMVPQKEGATYLAACDFLVAPTVPNPDGSPFFGSPTKIFEYMAMGKGIIASDLDQIGEILCHNKTALMVKPGDPDSLLNALKIFINNKELGKELGRAAREEAVAKHTWKEHTRKIIHELKERCPPPHERNYS